MKTREFGVVIGLRRGPRGKPVPTLDAAMLVADFRPAADLVAVITSRPMFPGAPRRQLVDAGRFLNFSRLGQGLPADKQALAETVRE